MNEKNHDRLERELGYIIRLGVADNKISEQIAREVLNHLRRRLDWREYAALSLVEQAVKDLNGFSGEVSGATTEKMRRLDHAAKLWNRRAHEIGDAPDL